MEDFFYGQKTESKNIILHIYIRIYNIERKADIPHIKELVNTGRDVEFQNVTLGHRDAIRNESLLSKKGFYNLYKRQFNNMET